MGDADNNNALRINEVKAYAAAWYDHVPPTASPTSSPTVSMAPTNEPTTEPTSEPTREPTNRPTKRPTMEPTCATHTQTLEEGDYYLRMNGKYLWMEKSNAGVSYAVKASTFQQEPTEDKYKWTISNISGNTLKLYNIGKEQTVKTNSDGYFRGVDDDDKRMVYQLFTPCDFYWLKLKAEKEKQRWMKNPSSNGGKLGRTTDDEDATKIQLVPI